jgi:hypothetical protein
LIVIVNLEEGPGGAGIMVVVPPSISILRQEEKIIRERRKLRVSNFFMVVDLSKLKLFVYVKRWMIKSYSRKQD